MNQTDQHLQALRERVKGTNINEQTLLATDYLNHLNEPIMLLEMVADMPDLLDELAEWRPKTYVEHFQDSGFTDKDLAIEAYASAPEIYRLPFEATIDKVNRCIPATVTALAALNDQGRTEEISTVATETAAMLGQLVDRASAIIHGETAALDQSQIDRVMVDGETSAPSGDIPPGSLDGSAQTLDKTA